jgi:hypothetical protein
MIFGRLYSGSSTTSFCDPMGRDSHVSIGISPRSQARVTALARKRSSQPPK